MALTKATYSMIDGASVSVLDFGADPTGATDSASAILAAMTYCAANYKSLFFPAGSYLSASNIIVPRTANSNRGYKIFGEGKHYASRIIFSGAAVTTGLTFNSSGAGVYQYWDTLSDLVIYGQSGALQGLTYSYAHAPRVENVQVNGFARSGVSLTNCNQPVLHAMLLANNGNASYAQIALDRCTAFTLSDNYVSQSNAGGVAGIDMDRCTTGIVLGGAIESTGTMIRIGNAAEGTTSCRGITLQSINMENPTDCYVKIGYGWTSTFGMQEIAIRDCMGYVSGSTTALIGVDMKHCSNVQVTNSRFGLVAGGTATFNLNGTTNAYIFIGANRNEFGTSIPWVLQNGTMVNAATPLVDWHSTFDVGQTLSISRSGTTATLNLSPLAAQGGVYNFVLLTNATPTTINRTSVIPAQAGYRLTLLAMDANTTIAHQGGGGTGQFRNTSGANIALGLNQAVTYVYNSSSGNWSQT